MGTTMRLLSSHPENLRAAFHQNISFLLDGGCIDPVFGVTHLFASTGCSSQYSFATFEGFREHVLFWKHIAAKVVYVDAEISSKRLFDDDVFSQRQRLDSKRFVGSGRCAEVDHVYHFAEVREVSERLDLLFLGKSVAPFLRFGGHTYNLDGHSVHAAEALPVKPGGKARSNNPDANWFLHERPPLDLSVPLFSRPSIFAPFLEADDMGTALDLK